MSVGVAAGAAVVERRCGHWERNSWTRARSWGRDGEVIRRAREIRTAGDWNGVKGEPSSHG